MKNILLLLTIAIFAGCATVETADNFQGTSVNGRDKPLATVAIENYGYYLFGFWPLIAGDPEQPNVNTCRYFTDTVTVDSNAKMFKATAEALNARAAEDVRTDITWTGSFSMWLVWRKTIFTSGLIVEK